MIMTTLDRTESEPEVPIPAEEHSAPGSEVFDEDTYLRAFPDVAEAIADGVCTSPLQHYLEHGRQEHRMSHSSYLALLQGRQIVGHIDFYGHNALAGGWIFCGWSAERWDETSPVRVVAHFRDGDIAGVSIAAFHSRDGLQGRGTGLILFIHAINEPLGVLLSIDVRVDGEPLTIFVESSARSLSDQDVASSVRTLLLLAGPESPNCRELFTLLSTSGFGRLRQPLNTLDGFVDLGGYHIASGGWFFCGWVTRAWDSTVGPDKFIVRFVDGDLVSDETVAGFYPRDDMEGRGVGFVMFVRGSGRPLGSLTLVEVQFGGVPSFIRASSSSQRLREAELASRLRPIVGQIADPDVNITLLSFLSRHPFAGADTLSALSDRVFLEFDEVIACPPDGVVVMGWFLAKTGVVRSMRLRSSTTNEPFDFDDCIKLQRPDVIDRLGAEHGFDDPRCGFIAYVPCALPANTEMYMEVETAQREVGYRRLPPPKLDGIAAIKRLLNTFDVRYNEVSRAFDRTVGPAIDLLNRKRLNRRPSADLVEFGRVNNAPEFTIIIPLYGRLDFIEYQLAFMSSHPAAVDYEFIFVLDDPPKRRAAERLFHSAFTRFRIPFRVLIMEQNIGFGPANNAGLREARGRYVCFLNSDVFPGPNDWLEQLARHLETYPDIGTIGPVLLYGDGSVQHQGMIFTKLPEFGNWLFPDHPGKGMRGAASAGLSRHISITGACMLMRRDVAVELGGFNEAFIIGDFEDTDLCLRLHGMGLDSAVDMGVQMYHLERKSQATSAQRWRMNLTLYNAWVHEKLWADTIARHPLRDGPINERPLAMDGA
jgi:GT2 family glycosyltransferase